MILGSEENFFSQQAPLCCVCFKRHSDAAHSATQDWSMPWSMPALPGVNNTRLCDD